MSKRRKVELQAIDVTQWPPSTRSENRTMDWNLCVLCQQPSVAPLVSPTVVGYTSLAKNLVEFYEQNALPPPQ